MRTVVKRNHRLVKHIVSIYIVANLLITLPLAWCAYMLDRLQGTYYCAVLTIFVFILVSILAYFLIDKPERYYLTNLGVLDGPKEYKYIDFRTLVFTLGFDPTIGYELILKYRNPYRNIRQNGRVAEYLPRLSAYDYSIELLSEKYEREMYEYPTDRKPVWSEIPFDRETSIIVLHHTSCSVYVTRSFLHYNQWSINEFSRQYRIPVDRITLINDGKKEKKAYYFDRINL